MNVKGGGGIKRGGASIKYANHKSCHFLIGDFYFEIVIYYLKRFKKGIYDL